MKFLQNYSSAHEAEFAAELLETNGIVAFVSAKNASGLGIYLTGEINVGLWVVLDHQYADAKAFLENNNHEITTKLSPQEITKIKEQNKVVYNNIFNKVIIILICIIALFIGVVYVFNQNQ